MKILLTLLFSLLVGQFGFSQVDIRSAEHVYQYKNVLKMSPVELGRSEFQIGYERYFPKRAQSILIMPSIIKSQRGEESKDGMQLMLQYRFYLSQLQRDNNETLNMYNIGFYTAPYLVGLTYNEVYEYFTYDPNNYEPISNLIKEEINAYEGGTLMGIQLDITRRIVFDIFVGGGIRDSKVQRSGSEEGYDEEGIFEQGYTGVKPRIGLQMGITF